MAPEKPAGSVFFHRTGTKCLFYLRYSADKGFHTFSDKIPALRFGQILSEGGLQKCKAESCGEDCHCKTFKILSGKFAAMFHLLEIAGQRGEKGLGDFHNQRSRFLV